MTSSHSSEHEHLQFRHHDSSIHLHILIHSISIVFVNDINSIVSVLLYKDDVAIAVGSRGPGCQTDLCIALLSGCEAYSAFSVKHIIQNIPQDTMPLSFSSTILLSKLYRLEYPRNQRSPIYFFTFNNNFQRDSIVYNKILERVSNLPRPLYHRSRIDLQTQWPIVRPRPS